MRGGLSLNETIHHTAANDPFRQIIGPHGQNFEFARFSESRNRRRDRHGTAIGAQQSPQGGENHGSLDFFRKLATQLVQGTVGHQFIG